MENLIEKLKNADVDFIEDYYLNKILLKPIAKKRNVTVNSLKVKSFRIRKKAKPYNLRNMDDGELKNLINKIREYSSQKKIVGKKETCFLDPNKIHLNPLPIIHFNFGMI